MIAERNATNMDEALSRLRDYARSNNLGLTATAEALINGAIAVDAIGPARRVPPPS